MLATIDHINAHILWDGSMMNRFCWSSVDVTTFEPYTEELKHFNTKTTVYNQDGGKGKFEKLFERVIHFFYIHLTYIYSLFF